MRTGDICSIARTMGAAVVMAFSAVSARGAQADPAHDLAYFKAIEESWLTDIRDRDVAALDRLLAPDFVDIMWNGHLRDKSMVLAAARQQWVANDKQTLQDIAVCRYGRVAVVTGLDSSARGRVRFTDVFVEHHGRWQAARAQETPLR